MPLRLCTMHIVITILRSLLLLAVPLTLMFSVDTAALSNAKLILLNEDVHCDTDHLIQWRIDGLDPASLQFDVLKNPRLVISDPHNQKITRHAFLYQEQQLNPLDLTDSGLNAHGERELRIRHQARLAGTHQWQLLSVSGDMLASGSLVIKLGKNPIGPLKVSKINPRLLSFQDEKVFIPIGCNIAWANAPRRLELIQSYLRKLAANGGTHFRLWMCSWSGQLESNSADEYRMDHAFLMDQILQSARNLGIYVTVVLDNHHDLVHGLAFPYGDDTSQRIASFLGTPLNPQYQRRIQYILARYGCDDHILAWELFNELDEALYNQTLPAHMPDMHGICAKWIAAAAPFLKENDQDRRLVTSSLSWQTWADVAAPEILDLVQIHEYIPVFERIHPLHHDGLLPLQTHLPRLLESKQPFLFSEIGHNGTNEHNPAQKLDPTGILMRQQAWAGLLFGGYGSGMAWWWDNYIDANDLWHVYQPLAKMSALLNWQDPELVALPVNQGSSLRVMGLQSPRQALIWPQLRANTWHALTIAGNQPQSYVGQNLVIRGFEPNQSFTITWYSMEDGHKHSSSQSLSSDLGHLQLICPPKQLLMVVHIRKQQD